MNVKKHFGISLNQTRLKTPNENANTAKEWQREMNAFLKALLVKSKQKRIKFPRLIEGLSSFRTARTVPSSSFVDSSLD